MLEIMVIIIIIMNIEQAGELKHGPLALVDSTVSDLSNLFSE